MKMISYISNFNHGSLYQETGHSSNNINYEKKYETSLDGKNKFNDLYPPPQNDMLLQISQYFCDKHSSSTTNNKTADVPFPFVNSPTSNNDRSSNNKPEMIKTSSKMPETKATSPNTWCPPNDHSKHRQQNGTHKKRLLQNIQRAVNNFDHDSGYVHKNPDPVSSLQTSYRPYETCQYRPHDFYAIFSYPEYPHQLTCMPRYNPKYCTPFSAAPSNSTFRKAACRGSNYKTNNDVMSVKPPKKTNLSKNNLKFTSDKRKLFQKTHWFREITKPNKVKRNQLVTSNRTEMYNNKVTRAMSPVISNQTSPSTCNPPKKTNSNNSKETGVLPLTRVAGPGDFANSCQISLLTQVCKQNENYSCSDSSNGSTTSIDSGFSCQEYDGNLEPVIFSDKAKELNIATGQQLCSQILSSSFRGSYDSDVESSDSDSDDGDDDSDEIQLTSSDDSDDDDHAIKFVKINECLHSSWLIDPSSEDSTVYSIDEDDDWDTIWSSTSTKPEVVTDIMSEFDPCPMKFTTFCSLSSKEEKVDVPDDEADNGIHQRLKEANERWNKVYGLEFNENYTPKVQFATGKKLMTRHLLFCWTYAYKAARISPWITLALDSQRFQKRIEELKPTIDPVLDPVHRQNVFNSRLQQGAESM